MAATILPTKFQFRDCRNGPGSRLLNGRSGPDDGSTAVAMESSGKTTAVSMDRRVTFAGFASATIGKRVTTAEARGAVNALGFGFPNAQANESPRLADGTPHQTWCC